MEITAIEDARVREAMNYYLLNLASTVPPNTLKAYKPKQEEWKVSPPAGCGGDNRIRVDARWCRDGAPRTGRRFLMIGL